MATYIASLSFTDKGKEKEAELFDEIRAIEKVPRVTSVKILRAVFGTEKEIRVIIEMVLPFLCPVLTEEEKETLWGIKEVFMNLVWNGENATRFKWYIGEEVS